MNRRNFLYRIAAMAAALAFRMDAAATPQYAKDVKPAPWPGTVAIRDGFTKIEDLDLLVEHVYLHPNNYRMFRQAFSNGEGWDEEGQEHVRRHGISGYLWGATVRLSSLVPEGNILLVSQWESEFDDQLLPNGPMLCWVR